MTVIKQNTLARSYLHWPLALIGGLLASLLIICLMTQLITPQDINTTVYKLLAIDFIQIRQTEAAKPTDPIEDSTPPPQSPPRFPEPPLTTFLEAAPSTTLDSSAPFVQERQLLPLARPTLSATIDRPERSPNLSPVPATQESAPAFDEDLYPLLTREPIYPSRAKRANIEGWVNVAFTITKEGKVSDIQIVAAQPEGVFENSTRNALENWRFKPQLLAGKPTARRVVQTIRFELQR